MSVSDGDKKGVVDESEEKIMGSTDEAKDDADKKQKTEEE